MNLQPYRRVAYVSGGILLAWIWRSETPFMDYLNSDVNMPIGLRELVYSPMKAAVRNEFPDVWGLAAATSLLALFIILIACWGAVRPNEPRLFAFALGEIMLASILTAFLAVELSVVAAELQKSTYSLFDIREGPYFLLSIIGLHIVAVVSAKIEDKGVAK